MKLWWDFSLEIHQTLIRQITVGYTVNLPNFFLPICFEGNCQTKILPKFHRLRYHRCTLVIPFIKAPILLATHFRTWSISSLGPPMLNSVTYLRQHTGWCHMLHHVTSHDSLKVLMLVQCIQHIVSNQLQTNWVVPQHSCSTHWHTDIRSTALTSYGQLHAYFSTVNPWL